MWFHTKCLEKNQISEQEEYLEVVKKSTHQKLTEPGLQIPQAILGVAFQPTARGGLTHFVAGNTRIVKFARSLLEFSARDKVVASHNWFIAHSQEITHEDLITDEDWRRFMEDEHGLKEGEGEQVSCEQLIAYGQTIFTCPFCRMGI